MSVVVEVECRQLEDGSIQLLNLPIVGSKDTIDVTIRPVKRSDRRAIRDIENQATIDDDGEEKMLSLLITQWGDRDGVTSQELMMDEYGEAVLIISKAFRHFFQREYKFNLVK
ncbi:MAG: hypothetical protein F6K31_30455 [Symploca sp. SIO2G7]|nr:hypothetical protein [Symploca sp. SIO2G7]